MTDVLTVISVVVAAIVVYRFFRYKSCTMYIHTNIKRQVNKSTNKTLLSSFMKATTTEIQTSRHARFVCSNVFICQICCQMQPTRFIKGKQISETSACYSSSTLYLSVRLHATACMVVSSTNSFPALSPSLPALHIAPANQSNHRQTDSPEPLSDYSCTYRHWCSLENPRTACW